jgi:hypothetical protein
MTSDLSQRHPPGQRTEDRPLTLGRRWDFRWGVMRPQSAATKASIAGVLPATIPPLSSRGRPKASYECVVVARR